MNWRAISGAEGPHQNLLDLEGYYYKLYTLGFSFGDEDEPVEEGYVAETAIGGG